MIEQNLPEKLLPAAPSLPNSLYRTTLNHAEPHRTAPQNKQLWRFRKDFRFESGGTTP
jgi:hypothetical protein